MEKLLAFTNCRHTKAEAVALAKWHREQNMLTRGTYKKNERGQACSVGCFADGDHSKFPELFGFSVPYAHLLDRVFEAHETDAEAADFHVWYVENTPEEADTMRIWWEFFALTVEGIGEEWSGFAAECRAESPDLKKISDLAVALDRALARALDRAVDLDPARARARDLARALPLALDRAVDLDLDRARAVALDRALALALALALDLDLDRAVDLENFKKAVEKIAAEMSESE